MGLNLSCFNSGEESLYEDVHRTKAALLVLIPRSLEQNSEISVKDGVIRA